MAAREVKFANVSFVLPGGRSILQQISLHVGSGETVALLGRSGSGKTTLLRMVNAMVTPTSGRVIVGGRPILSSAVIPLRRSIGYVIQETGLFPHLSLAQNIALPLELDRGRQDFSIAMEQAMSAVGLSFAEFAHKLPHQVSGGQRQRAGVARALVAGQDLLLMDEPFGALDPITRLEMQNMLRDLLRSVRKTTLIVTHDLEEALFLADRVVLLEQGQLVAEMPSANVLSSRHPAMQAYVRAARRSEPSA